jgi:predicted nucleic acid-binding Zn ribbon protein
VNKYKDATDRKRDVSPLKEVFEELLQAYKLQDRYHEGMVINAWGEMMGHTVSIRTSELSVRDKKLYVKLISGPVKKELMMNKSKILDLIADKFGNHIIEDIVFL